MMVMLSGCNETEVTAAVFRRNESRNPGLSTVSVKAKIGRT